MLTIPNQGDFVLRRQPPGKLLKSAHAVDREYRVITALSQTDVPVPRTYGYCDDEDVVGTKFFLMDHVKGNIYWELILPNLDEVARRDIYLSMNDTISKLHNVNFEKINLGDYGKHENYMPFTNGTSGPTMIRSIAFFIAKLNNSSKSFVSTI